MEQEEISAIEREDGGGSRKATLSYSRFTSEMVVSRFGLQLNTEENLFPDVAECAPSILLKSLLSDAERVLLASPTEKARSEQVITPILMEVWRAVKGLFALYSGYQFDVSPSEGLAGICDFLLVQTSNPLIFAPPVLAIVEAKKEDIRGGIGQCLAEMVAAQRFNERTGNSDRQVVYGAVTTGEAWRFLKLTGQDAYLDTQTYYLPQLNKILGILLYIVGDDSL